MNRGKTVDEYPKNATHFRDELVRLREILCSTPLTEIKPAIIKRYVKEAIALVR